MVAALAKPGRALAKRLLLIQASAVALVAVGMTVAVNAEWGISALIGGGSFVIANAVFALCAFLFSGARAAKKSCRVFLCGRRSENPYYSLPILDSLHVYSGGSDSLESHIFTGRLN